jgi:hypothetical protein
MCDPIPQPLNRILSLCQWSIICQPGRLVHRKKFFHIQNETALFQDITTVTPLMMFLLRKLTSNVSIKSISLMFPLPFMKLCEVDEHIRGQNLFHRLGEEETETVQTSSLEAEDAGEKSRM